MSLSPESRLCSCGEVINDCLVWRKRIDQICRDHKVDIEDWDKSFPLTWLRTGTISNKINDLVYWSGNNDLIRLVSRINPFSIGLKQSILNTGELHDIITSQDGASIMVDNTKNAIRMKAMNVFLGAKIIFLLRDGRAVTASSIRRGEGDMTKAAKTWKRSISNVLQLQKSISSNEICSVKYEDLCTDPYKTIAKICKFLSIEYDDGMLKISPDQYHTIPGNPWLTKSRSSEIKISKDERWKAELTKNQISTFESIAGELNKKLGY